MTKKIPYKDIMKCRSLEEFGIYEQQKQETTETKKEKEIF